MFSQRVDAGEAERVPSDRVICDPSPSMHIGTANVTGNSGNVFQFSGNLTYNPQNAPE